SPIDQASRTFLPECIPEGVCEPKLFFGHSDASGREWFDGAWQVPRDQLNHASGGGDGYWLLRFDYAACNAAKLGFGLGDWDCLHRTMVYAVTMEWSS